MKWIIAIAFGTQLSIQIMLKFGFLKYGNTTPMYEDLITTLLFCTMLIIFSIERHEKLITHKGEEDEK